jgi:hypothetical protein
MQKAGSRSRWQEAGAKGTKQKAERKEQKAERRKP